MVWYSFCKTNYGHRNSYYWTTDSRLVTVYKQMRDRNRDEQDVAFSHGVALQLALLDHGLERLPVEQIMVWHSVQPADNSKFRIPTSYGKGTVEEIHQLVDHVVSW